MLRLIAPILLVAAMLGIAACDSADTDDPVLPGQGNVTVTGDVTSSYSGPSFWTIFDETREDDMFAVGILRGSLDGFEADNFELVALFGGSSRPGTGEYEIDDDGMSAVLVQITPEHQRYVFASAGEISITTSTSTRVAGTASFSGQIFTEGVGFQGNASVQTSFDAIFIDEDDLPAGIDF